MNKKQLIKLWLVPLLGLFPFCGLQAMKRVRDSDALVMPSEQRSEIESIKEQFRLLPIFEKTRLVGRLLPLIGDPMERYTISFFVDDTAFDMMITAHPEMVLRELNNGFHQESDFRKALLYNSCALSQDSPFFLPKELSDQIAQKILDGKLFTWLCKEIRFPRTVYSDQSFVGLNKEETVFATTASNDGYLVNVYKVDDGQLLTTLRYDFKVNKVIFNRDGTYIAAFASSEPTKNKTLMYPISVRQVATGAEVISIPDEVVCSQMPEFMGGMYSGFHKASVGTVGGTAYEFSNAGNHFLITSNNTCKIVNLETGKILEIPASKIPIKVHKRGTWILNGNKNDKKIEIRNADTGELERSLVAQNESRILNVNKEGTLLVTCPIVERTGTGVKETDFKTFDVWDLLAGKKVQTIKGYTGSYHIYRKANRVLTYEPNCVRIIDLFTGQVVRTFNTIEPIVHTLLNKKGTFLGIGTGNKLTIYNVLTGELIHSLDERDLKGYFVADDLVLASNATKRILINCNTKQVTILNENGLHVTFEKQKEWLFIVTAGSTVMYNTHLGKELCSILTKPTAAYGKKKLFLIRAALNSIELLNMDIFNQIKKFNIMQVCFLNFLYEISWLNYLNASVLRPLPMHAFELNKYPHFKKVYADLPDRIKKAIQHLVKD